MNPALKNLCEQIDATVFTGDALEVGETLREFKEYLGRWNQNAIFTNVIAYRSQATSMAVNGAPSAEEHPSDLIESDQTLKACYDRGHGEGLAVPMLLDKNGQRSIFDDVDL
jgi:hypothetical protein